MTLGFKVGSELKEIGSPDLLQAFFSSIYCNLEPQGWGTHFPYIMNELYGGLLSAHHASLALAELDSVKKQFEHLPIDKVVYNSEDLSYVPLWVNRIEANGTNLSDYFIISTDGNLIELLKESLSQLQKVGGYLSIEKY